MSPTAVISGIGLVTPAGGDTAASWSSLLAGDAIRDHARCPLPPSINEGRVDQLALRAATEAIAAAPIDLQSDRTALVVGTSRGPVDDWLVSSGASSPTAGFGFSTVAGRVAATLGMGDGPRLTLTAACASGLHALIRAAMMIEQRSIDSALVVGAESSLHPIFLQSFRRLGVLAPAGGRCRPFDVNRHGLLVSEAAAAVVVRGVVRPSGGDIVLDRFAFAGNASHLTGFDPDGATIRRVLGTAIDGKPVDVIHAHGTGTVSNDATEADAIDSALAEASVPLRPSLYSHKGAVGHSLGASGLISVVLNVMMHRTGRVPPNAGTQTPIPVRRATIASGIVERAVRRSVVCAAGFGGATAAVSLTTA